MKSGRSVAFDLEFSSPHGICEHYFSFSSPMSFFSFSFRDIYIHIYIYISGKVCKTVDTAEKETMPV